MRHRRVGFDAHPLNTLALLAGLILPASCGVIYTSPNVTRTAGGVDVREIALTPETVIMANRSPYSPRNLPQEFYSAASASQGPGLGTLPEAPQVPNENPALLELRPPPDLPDQPYRLGVGDVVLLATKQNGSSVDQLSGLLAAQIRRQGYVISDDRAISIPDIGRVEIGGLTLQEAQDEIFRFLLDNQVDPAFSLEVEEFNSQRVTVGGAVGTATRLPITLVPLTLNEALTASGGVQLRDEQFASIRIYRDGTLYQIPYKDYLERRDLQTLRLTDGDAIYVDTTYDLERAFEFYQREIDIISLRNQARSDSISRMQAEIGMRRGMLEEKRENFQTRMELGAEARDYIYLVGEVSKPARVTLPYEQHTTLADVLFENGGFPTRTADAANIYVLRPSANPADFGAVTAWHLNAANAVNMTLATRLEMRPNDIVFVEEQPVTTWGRSIEQILPTVFRVATVTQ